MTALVMSRNANRSCAVERGLVQDTNVCSLGCVQADKQVLLKQHWTQASTGHFIAALVVSRKANSPCAVRCIQTGVHTVCHL